MLRPGLSTVSLSSDLNNKCTQSKPSQTLVDTSLKRSTQFPTSSLVSSVPPQCKSVKCYVYRKFPAILSDLKRRALHWFLVIHFAGFPPGPGPVCHEKGGRRVWRFICACICLWLLSHGAAAPATVCHHHCISTRQTPLPVG